MAAQRLSQLSVEQIPYAERALIQSSERQGIPAMTQPHGPSKQLQLNDPTGDPSKNHQMNRQVQYGQQNRDQNEITSYPQAIAAAKSQMAAESAARDTELSLTQQYAMNGIRDTMYGTTDRPGTGAKRTMELGSLNQNAFDKLLMDVEITRAQNTQAPELSQVKREEQMYS